jgi:DNA topoisomerase VI subunit A
MLSLAKKLWTDKVGSTMMAEMAIVTGITISALFMSMSNFSATVNREFNKAAQSSGLTMDDVDKKKKEKEEKKAKEQAARELEFEAKREWFRQQKGEG